MNPRIRSLFLAAAATLVVSAPARATIVDGLGTHGFKKLTVPFTESHPDNTVGQDTFENPTLYGFDEDQNIVINSALVVDFGSGLPIGTEVASHYVCFDPVQNSTQGYVEFDANVLAIISTTNNLLASDFLANNDVIYRNPAARGLEPDDFVAIDPNNPRRIIVAFNASSPGDYIRVLTARSRLGVPPDVSGATPTVGALWPPNHKFTTIGITGVVDPEGEAVTIRITEVRQDEAVDGAGSGPTAGPDATISGDRVALRAERAGTGDGRVYHVTFVARDASGFESTGTVRVSVPHSIHGLAVDGGPLFDSTQQ